MRALFLTVALCGIFFVSVEAQDIYPTGEVFDAELYNSLPLKARVSTRSILPPRVSLEQYCPTPGDQGNYGTCSSYASAYHLRTIMEAKRRGITDRAEIDKIVFSPTWVNELLKQETDNTCNAGVATPMALVVFKELGVVPYSRLPFECMQGTKEERLSRLDPLAAEAANYRIRDLQILYLAKDNVPPDEKVTAIKKVLSEGYPVLISHTLPRSFHTAKEVWMGATEGEKLSEKHGSHAMVIVGYDDEKYGGAFRYLNSWGEGWGDKGFTWVPYAATGRWCYGAYQAFPMAASPAPTPAPTPPAPPAPQPVPLPTPPAPAPAPVAESLPAGSMEFRLNTGEPMDVVRISTRNLVVEDDVGPSQERAAYRMRAAYPSGTRFRFYLETQAEGYVYAFATDLGGQINKIFPYDDQVSPLVGSNSTIAFPSDTKVIRMDNRPGTDYLLVLYSQQALNVPALLRQMSASTKGLSGSIEEALGSALIDPADIQYTPQRAGFTVRPGARGTVVPLMVEISHQ